MSKRVFEIEMKVREYECDAQGIVNNANYLHYFENTRHEFLSSMGISFMESHRMGIDPVVARADLRYHTSLTGSETFLSSLTVERKGVKIVFIRKFAAKTMAFCAVRGLSRRSCCTMVCCREAIIMTDS
ncbi:MAG: putative esterase [Candidatus Ordinivivax streblomastigis]|uniref:Putative esterase n=1 Tax=Candidatus Ordinivivax streblomastigis TaxID=2540710 RepID=A0A5M8NYI5_9BACT|nr:MAG: putative esterase [Candidatus Ordinivivax streblomastigis]